MRKIQTNVHGNHLGLSTERTLVSVAGIEGLGIFPAVRGAPRAVGDGSHDDTVALQAWINALEDSASALDGSNPVVGRLPAGHYVATTLNITRPLVIEGAGGASQATIISQVANTTTPLIKFRVAHDGYDYPPDKNIPATITLKGLKLIGGDQLSGQTGQHGIDIQAASSNAVKTRIVLDDVDISRFSGHGINAASMDGWVDGHLVRCHDNTLYGMSANSCNDFHFVNSYFDGNHSSGMLLSGCSEFSFTTCNIFSNLAHGVNLFTSSGLANHRFLGCMFDRNYQSAINNDLRSTSAHVDFVACSVIYSSQEGDNLYSEVNFAAGALGRLKFMGGQFGRTLSQTTTAIERSQYHVNYAGAGGLAMFDPSVAFLGGALLQSADRVGAQLNGGLNLAVSAAPASPVDGDIWRQDNTNTGLKVRINGVTKTITVS